MTPRAAPAEWPYNHRSVAELDEAEAERRSRKSVKISGPLATHKRVAAGLVERTSLPTGPCLLCGDRGWCGHAGRVAA